MNNNILNLIIVVIFITTIIYIVKNNNEINNFIENKLRNKKYFKILKRIIFLSIFVVLLIFVYIYAKDIKENIEFSEEMNAFIEMTDEKEKIVKEQNKKYQEIIAKNYENSNYSKPYILEGFSYKEGSYDNGYVITDEDGNEYVWVPCTNKEIANIEKLQKSSFVATDFISKDFCYEEIDYEYFLNSALTNGGFYISRYEIGEKDGKAVSQKSVQIYTKKNKSEITEIVENIYTNENFKCELANGYAYDTVLNWIFNTNNIKSTNKITIDESKKIYSGRNEYNHIYDMLDNIFELTSEMYYDACVMRGFEFFEETLDKDNRFSINKNEAEDLLSFRTILYK